MPSITPTANPSWSGTIDNYFAQNPNASTADIQSTLTGIPGATYDSTTGTFSYDGGAYTPTRASVAPVAPVAPVATLRPTPVATWTPTSLNASDPNSRATASTWNAVNVNAGDPNSRATTSTWNANTVNAFDPNSRTTAVTWDPNADALVENRLNGLLSQDSAYMQQARSAGLQTAAQRGLLNTNIAANSSQAAAIAAGFQIASQDANTYTNAGMANAAARNRSNEFNADAFNQRDLANALATNRAGEFNANANNTTSQFNANLFSQRDLANANAANSAGQFNTNAANEASRFNADLFNQRDLQNNLMLNDASKFNVGETNTTERLGTELASRERVSADTLAGQQAIAAANVTSNEAIANSNRDAASITAAAAREATLLQSSGSIIASSFDTHNAYVKSLYADPDLDPETRQILEYNSAVGTREIITLTSSVFGNEDVSAILGDFGTPQSLPGYKPEWSSAVDDYLAQNPNATATDIQNTLAGIPGAAYDPATGNYTYQGETYRP